MARRVGGILFIKANGVQLQVKGNWTWNLGVDRKEAVVGADGVHGYKQMPRAPFIEGAITDKQDLDVAALQGLTDATIVAELANGKVLSFNDAWAAGDWDQTSEEGEIAGRFEAMSAQEIT